MNITIKNLRILLTILSSLILFIGSQIVKAGNPPEKATLFEALILGLIIFFLWYAMFSDWIYNTLKNNTLKNHNFHISYKLFQIIAFIIIFAITTMIMIAMYNSYHDTYSSTNTNTHSQAGAWEREGVKL